MTMGNRDRFISLCPLLCRRVVIIRGADLISGLSLTQRQLGTGSLSTSPLSGGGAGNSKQGCPRHGNRLSIWRELRASGLPSPVGKGVLQPSIVRKKTSHPISHPKTSVHQAERLSLLPPSSHAVLSNLRWASGGPGLPPVLSFTYALSC